MIKQTVFSFFFIILTGFISACDLNSITNDEPNQGTLQGSPLDHLPPHITQLTDFGSRATWSPDGKNIIFLDKMIGDVFRIDILTKQITNLTDHYENYGYSRAHYLPNGDIILSGPKYRDLSSDDIEEGRFDSVLWILENPFDKPAILLDEPCWEGIAVSQKSMKIAWQKSNIHSYFSFLSGYSEIWVADIAKENGVPVLKNKKKIIERNDVSRFNMLEAQDFRPPEENELIFSAYIYKGTEVMGYDFSDGTIINYSNSKYYEEPEGIFPDGIYITVERELAVVILASGIDIWKLKLDGSGKYQRLTFFNYYKGFGAGNPVVSNDGKYMAFQLKDATKPPGNGNGLLLFDLKMFEQSTMNKSRNDE